MGKKGGHSSPDQTRLAKEALKQTATSMAQQGKWREAFDINQVILSHYVPEADDYNRLGKCHLELEQLTEARDAYENALRIDPTNAIALRNSTAIKARIKSLPKQSVQKQESPVPLPPSDKEESPELKYDLNTHVRIKVTGTIGIVTEILPQAQYRIFIREHEEPIVSESDIEELTSGTGYVTAQEFLRDLLIFKMRRPLSDTLYSYSMSRTNFEAYQFKPAIKFLNNPYGKILIADEVGLGKTIEACIIYLELKARMRGDLPRALVVCPSGLRLKWQSELSSRFGEEFELMDSPQLQRFFAAYRDSGGSKRLRGICSIEGLRRPELSARIAELGVDFDLVIIDEAHHMRNPETQSFDLGETLSDHADHLIMLTATPVHLHSDDLYYLLNILEPGEFENKEVFQYQLEPNKLLNKVIAELCKEPVNLEGACSYLDMCPPHMKEHPYWTETRGLVETIRDLNQVERRQKLATAMRNLSELNTFSLLFTRTRRKEVQSGVLRSAVVVDIPLTEKEQEIYSEALHFARARAQHNKGYVFMLGLIQIERQLASSIGAFREIIEDFGKNRTDESEIEGSASELDWSNTLPIEEVYAIGMKLLTLYNELGDVDTKYDTFHTELASILNAEPSAKVIVYSFFRKTLAYLLKRLTKDGYKVEVIHGGKGVIERQNVMDRFKQDSELHILLSSEVGAEGLDFQFCNTIINYDLPWNPMRVEQRIGRIDRYGQKSERVRIISLFLKNTIEERILKRLYKRIGVFKESIGALEPILGDIVAKLSQDVIGTELTPEQEHQKAEAYLNMLEHRKLELEDYEKHRYELMGQDMSFVNQVENNISSGRYVSAKEIRALVFQYLLKECPRTTLQPVERETDIWFLMPDQVLLDKLRSFLGKRANHSGPEDWNFLGLMNDSISTKSRYFTTRPRGFPITFNNQLALERPRLVYVNVWHPLVRLAFDSLAQATLSDPETRILRLNLKGRVAEKTGIRYFYMFYMSASAMVDSNELVTVAADTDGNIDDELSGSFLRLINDYLLEDSPGSNIDYDWQLGRDLKVRAFEFMAEMKRQKEIAERQRNDSLIAIRRSALEKTYEVKRRRGQGRLDEATNERIIRMHQAEIRNLEGKLQNAISELENKKQVSVSYEPIACGLVEF